MQGSDQWLRRWSLMLASATATSGPGVGKTPGLIAPVSQAGGASLTPLFTGLLSPTEMIGAGSGWQLSSDDPMGPYQSGGLRIKFNVRQANSNTPNTADIWIYNLADQTSSDLIQEFNNVVLQAGYQGRGHFGVIFAGEIKQYKKGHENATDSYLRIFAADGDVAIRNAVLNHTNAAGTSSSESFDKLAQAFEPHGVSRGYVQDNAVEKPPNIRPEVQFGPAADLMRDYASSGPDGKGAVWSIDNGKLNLVKTSAYEPGDIVKLNSHSGLIGWPEITQDGVYLTGLINTAIRLRQRVQLDNAQINQYFTPGGISGTQGAIFNFNDKGTWFSPVQADGIYAAWVIDYEGDSHGQAWYQHMTCLVVKSDVDAQNAIPAGLDYGSAA
jgi:hypothetical protein